MSIKKITSPRLSPLDHGFFTRDGGVSKGVYAGLNCGIGSLDDRAAVHENKARVAEDFGLQPEALIGVHQIHSATAVVVDQPTKDRPKADALVTAIPGLGLSVLSADCQPVLFADHKSGVIAAAHAGWRGALDGVLEATVSEMERLGANRDDIHAVIGPCISQAAYEVGEEFFENFADTDPAYTAFFVNGATSGKYMFDLPRFGLSCLRASGIQNCEWVGECTYSSPEKYYSYRRTTHKGEADYGRLISVIRL
ncbi:MAG: peptidoglycan editing factor PgeF [Paracoccaceae bacterium]